jgi:geranylgeranyl diphosphate synthase type I
MHETSDRQFFAERLKRDQHQADDTIRAFWDETMDATKATYGDASGRALQAFADIMERGGKRIRGALATEAYRMFGGTDDEVIRRISLALEMIHAYLLITDDISDKSDLRRGGASAHKLLEKWHAEGKLAGEQAHFGANIATLAAMTGMHEAMAIIAELPVEPERRTAALANLNRLLVVTCHGQINDLYNEATSTNDASQIEHVLLWKTAYYSFVNPLQLGAILAGAPSAALTALERFSLEAGRAFQISDDILGLFGSQDVTGKHPIDDLREGKRTLLVLRALEQASSEDAEYLNAQLGNPDVTEQDLQRCLGIIKDSGALDSVRTELASSCDKARQATQSADLPQSEGTQFLRGLVDFLQTRDH